MRESGSGSDGITVPWNGMPEPDTSSASSPRRPPMKRKLISGSVSRSASAPARSGLTCPPVPPPTISTRHARALRGAGSTNVQEDTHGDEPDTERAAAVRDEREGDTGHRHEARDDGHVHPGLEAEPHRDAGREQRSGRVLRAERDPHAAERKREEEQDDQERPGETELVAEDRKDRVRVRVRQVAEFFLPRPQALAERTAQPERVEHLDGLESVLLRIRPRVEEREQSLIAVWLGDREREHDHRGQPAERGELSQARARREVHREGDDHHNDRGAEVGLCRDESDEQRGDAERSPRRLLGEERARIVVRVERGDAARAVHHREPEKEKHENDGDERKVVRRGARETDLHEVNDRTMAVNFSPRSSADENMSNDAQAGESRTTSPGRAIALASATASSSLPARRTSSAPFGSAVAMADAISSAARPISTAPRARRARTRASSPKSAPFETPPRMAIAGRS